MQKIATRIFIYASVAFGVLGVLVAIIAPGDGANHSTFDTVLMRSFITTIFIILPSFALSVAGKYLNGSNK
ncbi:MAG TPA: hypothetical protein VLF62_03970 [Candidatus Saccharimonadales bacterium]|nr:hypothetical protein [Candidatus Saccharimonadales bacterium]